jgi:hypothetical protein
MFRQIARQLSTTWNGVETDTNYSDGAKKLIILHPAQLAYLLEWTYNNVLNVSGKNLGEPFHRVDQNSSPNLSFPDPALSGITLPAITLVDASGVSTTYNGFLWHHMIYAYMIENTHVLEVFRRILQEFRNGEKLGSATLSTTQLWLRNTEELFFKDTSPFSISSITSYIRPDHDAIRRNAYMRLFGMDLNHGTIDNKPYPYIRADASNNEFVSTFEEFLREVWIGIMYYPATAAPHPIDDQKIATLASMLRHMLMSRRINGNLSREEFVIVSMMEWFHMTLEVDPSLDILLDLKAEASGAEQKLFKCAQRVGVQAHGLSRSYFSIANAISTILIQIETGIYDDPIQVPALYDKSAPLPNGVTSSPEADMNTIITHWSIITGRDMKAGKVATT